MSFAPLIFYDSANFKVEKALLTAITRLFSLIKSIKICVTKSSFLVVTGSTDGIGKEYAKELAKQGLNIVLISRTESKLATVAKEIGEYLLTSSCALWPSLTLISCKHSIESTYSVKTKIIVADFGMGREIYDEISRQLQLLDVGILVNNVGRMYDFPNDLDQIPEDLLWQIININVGAVTMMSRIIIPQMKINRRGIIVNISSGSECQPTPLMVRSDRFEKFYEISI
jgi:17beta-estradiol 17-dehydrogenase / very-long-chain 3-oxoacyl-CoA reductase